MSEPKISGVFTPNMVPLDKQGRINEAEFRRYIDWLIAKGVTGLYPNGSTGEFTRFSPEERRWIIKICADQAKGRVPILAGAAEANVRDTLLGNASVRRDGCTGRSDMRAVLLQALAGKRQRILHRACTSLTTRYRFSTTHPQFANEIAIPTVVKTHRLRAHRRE